ncbi:velvet factor-domain-containing protein [Mycena galopus ATCC 62051]|nr:velvet factor-domain-containing protein [Mycena galopus ATCC 62051]
MGDFDWRGPIPNGWMESLLPWDGTFTRSELAAPPLQLQIGESRQRHCGISPANPVGPIHRFTEGRFSGQTLRAELNEIQTPKYGRRFATVDRRTLDDPPVTLLRLFDVHNAGITSEWEQEVQNYDDIPLTGLICMVDLFEVPQTMRAPFTMQPPLLSHNNFNPHLHATSSAQMTPGYHPSATKLPSDTLVLINGHPVTESSKRTMSLFGSKFVEPHKIGFPGKNQKQIVFTLSDLAVRLEGHFILRYRFFDILSNTSTILAECYGVPFKIYSSKEAPPLKESTMLTKLLATHGVPVKVRHKPRSPRKRQN